MRDAGHPKGRLTGGVSRADNPQDLARGLKKARQEIENTWGLLWRINRIS